MKNATEPLPLTVIVHTKNAAATLATCLESVKDIAQEILVVDMESTDDTRKIAREFSVRLLKTPDIGFVEPARQAAIEAARSEWILILDADEELPSSLAKHLPELMQQDEVNAYSLPRKNLIFGQWAQSGWWPDYQVRLFRAGTVHWPRELHAQPQITGSVLELSATEELAILHHNYPDIDSFVDRAQRYSTIAAEEIASGKRESETHLIESFGEELLKRYFLHEGYRQGRYGLTLATLQAYFEVLSLAKYWENTGFRDSTPSQPLSKILDKLADDVVYWELHEAWKEATGLRKLWYRLRMKARL